MGDIVKPSWHRIQARPSWAMGGEVSEKSFVSVKPLVVFQVAGAAGPAPLPPPSAPPWSGNKRNRRRFHVPRGNDARLLVAVAHVRDRTGIDLSIHNQAEQEIGSFVFDKRTPAIPNEPMRAN